MRSGAVGVIAIRFRPESLVTESTKNSKAFLESLITSALVALLFFGIIYHMTLRPIEELRYEIEEVQRGKKRNIEGKLLMGEITPLKNQINSLLQRLRDFQNTGGENAVEEEDVGPYITTLKYFMAGNPAAAIILDNKKQLQAINPLCENITAIRESSSIGVSILDLTKEKGLAATIIELCDASANNGGSHQQGQYDLQGRAHKLNVVAAIGKDNFAKGFLVSFVKEE